MPSQVSTIGILAVIAGLFVIVGIVGTSLLPRGYLAPYLRTQVNTEEETPSPGPTESETPAASENPPPAECGNGRIDNGETCDVGPSNGREGYPCTADCQLKCGNGIVEAGEQCDYGPDYNGQNNTGCSADCRRAPICGNGTIEPPEECDKGTLNGEAGSSCTSDCTIPEPPAPSPAPVCENEELACLCQYEEVTECAGLTAQGEQVCETTNTPPHGDRPECQWVNGQCESRFKQDCRQWLAEPAQQNECTTSFGPTPDTIDPATIPGFIKQCQNVRVERLGHGEGCYGVARRARLCFRHGNNGIYEDLGCSSVENQAEAEAEMRRLQGELLPGQKITIAMNQGTGLADPRFRTCNTLVSYQVTIEGVDVTFDECRPPGALCVSPYEVSTCSPDPDNSAAPRKEICCPNDNGIGNSWQPGSSCTSIGECGGNDDARDPFGFACVEAGQEARRKRDMCLAGAKILCEETGGTFTGPYDVGYDLECESNRTPNWPFCRANETCEWKCVGGNPNDATRSHSAIVEPTTCTDTQTVKSGTSKTEPLQCNTPTVAAMSNVAKCLDMQQAECEKRGGTFTSANQVGSTLKSLVSELRAATACTVKAESEWRCSGGTAN